MANLEMNGLKVIVDAAVEHGTIHVLREPPRREDYADDSSYSFAHQQWWSDMHLWSAKIIDVGDGDA